MNKNSSKRKLFSGKNDNTSISKSVSRNLYSNSMPTTSCKGNSRCITCRSESDGSDNWYERKPSCLMEKLYKGEDLKTVCQVLKHQESTFLEFQIEQLSFLGQINAKKRRVKRKTFMSFGKSLKPANKPCNCKKPCCRSREQSASVHFSDRKSKDQNFRKIEDQSNELIKQLRFIEKKLPSASPILKIKEVQFLESFIVKLQNLKCSFATSTPSKALGKNSVSRLTNNLSNISAVKTQENFNVKVTPENSIVKDPSVLKNVGSVKRQNKSIVTTAMRNTMTSNLFIDPPSSTDLDQYDKHLAVKKDQNSAVANETVKTAESTKIDGETTTRKVAKAVQKVKADCKCHTHINKTNSKYAKTNIYTDEPMSSYDSEFFRSKENVSDSCAAKRADSSTDYKTTTQKKPSKSTSVNVTPSDNEESALIHSGLKSVEKNKFSENLKKARLQNSMLNEESSFELLSELLSD